MFTGGMKLRSGTVIPSPVTLAIEPARTERRWQAIPIHPVFKQMVDPTNLVLVEEIAHYLDYRPGRHGCAFNVSVDNF